jgi:hypothetical protein
MEQAQEAKVLKLVVEWVNAIRAINLKRMQKPAKDLVWARERAQVAAAVEDLVWAREMFRTSNPHNKDKVF